MRRLLLFCLAMTIWVYSSSIAAHAQQAVIMFGCLERDHAEALAGEITENNAAIRDPRWASCWPIRQPVEDMTGAPTPFMGPLADWEGDPFALYEVDGGFFIIYWLRDYRPMSAEL